MFSGNVFGGSHVMVARSFYVNSELMFPGAQLVEILLLDSSKERNSVSKWQKCKCQEGNQI